MLLADAGLLENVEIVATDISQKAIARARRGEHGATALRVAPRGLQTRWMNVHDGRVTVAPQIRERIDWRRLNLLDEGAVASLGTFDVILCRNVLIYFRDETIRRVVGSLSGALSAGGRLFVGASESLIRFGTTLQCQERNGAFSYFRVDP
jgi:chemotaxis protein methyltransferase CheR